MNRFFSLELKPYKSRHTYFFRHLALSAFRTEELDYGAFDVTLQYIYFQSGIHVNFTIAIFSFDLYI